MFPGFTLSLDLWTLFAPHLDYCCLPGLSLFALPLLDIVRRSSTHACPKDYSVSCPCHTCLQFIDPACIMTMFWNKSLHLDPHVSRLVRPVTVGVRTVFVSMRVLYMFVCVRVCVMSARVCVCVCVRVYVCCVCVCVCTDLCFCVYCICILCTVCVCILCVCVYVCVHIFYVIC